MVNIKNSKAFSTTGIVVLVAALAIACFAWVAPAYAANKQMTAPTTVSDDITRLSVSKLDADTHDYVSGATMAIINEATGEVVDSWVTTAATHENEKGLDVGVVYILREVEAPEGYSKVEDVRFIVNEVEGTGITILSQGTDSNLTESYKVSLYDKALDRENVVTVTETNNNTTKTTTTKAVAPKTGDETPLSVVGALMAIGVLAIVGLQFSKRRVD